MMAGSTTRPSCTRSQLRQCRRLVGNHGCWRGISPIGTIWLTGGM